MGDMQFEIFFSHKECLILHSYIGKRGMLKDCKFNNAKGTGMYSARRRDTEKQNMAVERSKCWESVP